jgi:hypothetical protein
MAAIKAMHDEAPAKPTDREQNFGFDFFAYEQAGSELDFLKKEEAATLRYPIVLTTDEPVTVTVKGKSDPLQNEPPRGVKVEGGWLVAVDHGEWGGSITFVDAEGNPRALEDANTEAIYKTEQGIFAITGLAHLSGNHGFVYRISKNDEGRWTATKWRALPGAPRFSRLLQDGRLFVNCVGGIVIVSPDGGMQMQTRKDALTDAAGKK